MSLQVKKTGLVGGVLLDFMFIFGRKKTEEEAISSKPINR